MPQKFITNEDLRMPHLLAIFYFRTAWDLHKQGKTLGEAEKEARAKTETYPGIPMGCIFPPIPWGKLE